MPELPEHPEQISELDKKRIAYLAAEMLGTPHNIITVTESAALYSCLLLKDLLWSVNELLQYKQNEMHQ